MEWNRETILHFISLIKQRPAFWDFQSPEYKNKRKRHEAIEEVGLLMGVTPKEVNTKWIILRNQYSREKRKITESKGDSQYTTKWYAYKEMDALMARNKRQISSFWMQESKSETEDSSCSSPPPPSPRLSGSANQHSHTDCVTQSSSIYNKAIKTLKAIREAKNDSISDELTNYGLYIAAHLRKLSPPLQSRAKYEINKILYALDLESLGEYSAATLNADSDDIIITKECKFDPLEKD
ncbi:unnamed protein product [Arctia plantaginis]|uniref:MADF domain-containing protein n=1 Tax=Arctia plantaginis TaxID=874455 RepID=A0A8S1AM04_ARCPL|nr:unnamed protein product [Arctia plantaginis]